MTDNNELDDILSGNDEDVIVDETPEVEDAPTEIEVAQADNQAPEAKADEPEPVEPAEEVLVEQNESSMVPQAALHAARKQGQEAKSENQSLRDQIQQMQGQLNGLSQRPQAPQPTAEPEIVPELWDSPDDFMAHKLNPIQEQMREQKEGISRMMAEEKHGREVVQEAYQALGNAMQTDPNAAHEYQRIMASTHPYGALVDWNTSQKNQQMVGDDPQKWFESEMEKRLADPVSSAAILEKIRGNVSEQSVSQAPNIQLPPSISGISGAGNTVSDTDDSSEAMFNGALG